MLPVKKILSFSFFICYNLYAFSALGPNVQMEAALNVPIAAVPGVPFANANLFDPALAAAGSVGAAAIAVAGVNAGPLGAVPAQIGVHSDTVAVDKFISYCHNSSLGDFDPAAAAVPAPVPAAAAAAVQMNALALVNRLREFYSTNINDLSRVFALPVPRFSAHGLLRPYTEGSGWSTDDLRHISLAAITIISRSPPVVPPTYDYRTFFFGDVFRSGQNGSPLSPAFAANSFLPNHFFQIFGQNIPTPGGPVSLSFSGNWLTVNVGRVDNQAHSEGAFCDFLGTGAASPFDIRVNLITHVANTADILAFIIHLKNREPICSLLTNPGPLPVTNAIPFPYESLMKGMYFSAFTPPFPSIVGLQATKPSHCWLLNIVHSPFLPNIPIPGLANNIQNVRIIFIIGNGLKNIDIIEQ